MGIKYKQLTFESNMQWTLDTMVVSWNINKCAKLKIYGSEENFMIFSKMDRIKKNNNNKKMIQ